MKINHLYIKMLFVFFIASLASPSFADMNVITSREKCPTGSGSMQLRCVSYHQTTGYTCGPAVAMTLMHYYGLLSSGDMNKKTEMRIASEMGAEPNGGTSVSQLVSWLRSKGLSVDSGQNISSAEIINNLKKGIPTIIGFNDHWILAKGYNKGSSSTYQNQDEITFADSCCGIKVIPSGVIDSSSGPSINPKQCGNISYIVATR